MTPPDADLESSLVAAYREMAECYGRALRLADQLASGVTQETSLRQIDILVREAAGIDNSIVPLKLRWKECGREPGRALSTVLAELASMIENLSRSVRDAEQRAGAQRQLLAPALDAAARGTRMRQAYGRK